MLHVLPDGDKRHRLIDDYGNDVGWIRGRAVRFFGFASEEQVVGAARRAWGALQRVLRRGVTDPSAQARLRSLHLVHDGAYEWIADGAVPVARLFRPSEGSAAASYAIELVVPSYADDSMAIPVAHAIAKVLRPVAPPNHVHGQGDEPPDAA